MQRAEAKPRDELASTFLPSRPALLATVVAAAASLAAALYLRYAIIQNTPIGLACEAGERSAICALRLATILLFGPGIFGWTAVIAALIQLWRPHALVFAVGLIAAMFGIVLYNTRLSSLAVALLVLSLARLWQSAGDKPQAL